MPVCNNNTTFRTQDLRLTETLVFRSCQFKSELKLPSLTFLRPSSFPQPNAASPPPSGSQWLPCTLFPLHYSRIILPFHTILKAAADWDIMLCWLVTRSWRCREGCWYQLHGDQRIIFSYYKDIIRKLLQNVGNKLPINKVSYGHLWVDGPNMIYILPTSHRGLIS
jgi:hypothetical protein